MNKSHNKIWLQGIIPLVDILLSWAVFYICIMWLSDIFGPDIIEYENWFGDLENPVKHRFGIGSVEILLTLIQAFLFVCLEIILYKKKKIFKTYTCIAIIIHAVNLLLWILFYIDWNAWISISELLPQYIVLRILYNV